jgi:hypothetical protein
MNRGVVNVNVKPSTSNHLDHCFHVPLITRSPTRQRELAVGDREQDGVGRRDRDLDWPVLSRTYLAPFAHG